MLIDKIVNYYTTKIANKPKTKQSEKTVSKPEAEQYPASHIKSMYGRAQLIMDKNGVQKRLDTMGDYKNKTYGPNFAIKENQRANGIKNRAQFILLPKAIEDVERAQLITKHIIENYGGDLLNAQKTNFIKKAIQAQKNHKPQSDNFFVKDNLVNSRFEDSLDGTSTMIVQSVDNDLRLEYVCSNYQATPDACFELRKIETPRYAIFLDNETILQIAKYPKKNEDNTISAQKFYSFDCTPQGENFTIYENCTYEDNTEIYKDPKPFSYEGLYRFIDTKEKPDNAQGKLVYFEEEGLKNITNKPICYEYIEDWGWQSWEAKK